MPRYELAPEDLSDLVAYIRQIDRVSVPGVTDTSIRIGIALPPASTSGQRPDLLLMTISAYITSINESGGIYRRQLDPIILEPDRHNEPVVFAAIGGFTPDGDPSTAQTGLAQIPLVCVYHPPDLARPADHEKSFALFSGHAGQARTLATFVAERTDRIRLRYCCRPRIGVSKPCACRRNRRSTPACRDEKSRRRNPCLDRRLTGRTRRAIFVPGSRGDPAGRAR